MKWQYFGTCLVGITTTASGNTLYQKPLETMLFERRDLSDAGRLLKSVRCESGPLADSQPLHLTEQRSITQRGSLKRTCLLLQCTFPEQHDLRSLGILKGL